MLDALGDEDQEILKLVAWDGLTPSQAAVALGISAVAARTRLHRARRRLASLLNADEQRPPTSKQIIDANPAPEKSTEVTDA